jgi:FkbM family methyltransferase
MRLDKYFLNKVYYLLIRNFSKYTFRNVSIRNGFIKNYRWCINAGGNYYPIGIYEEETVSMILDNLNENDVFYDIGANTGYLSMIAAKKVGPLGKVYAFEPMDRNISFLNEHIHINLINNIFVFDMAVSDKRGIVRFSLDNNQSANTYVEESLKFKNVNNYKDVLTESLDSLFFKNEITVPKLIKIDVEGAEYDVLKGAKEILQKFGPTLILSTHEKWVPGIDKKCVLLLESYGYQLNKIDNSNSTTYMPGLDDYLAYKIQ